jgi:hypothetical protein
MPTHSENAGFLPGRFSILKRNTNGPGRLNLEAIPAPNYPVNKSYNQNDLTFVIIHSFIGTNKVNNHCRDKKRTEANF